MVLLIVLFAPWRASLAEHRGLPHMISYGTIPLINISTVFIGLGVLGFAFVCQHSAFLNAASLERPTRRRWGTVTRRALAMCLVLESSCGIFGYLAFLDETEGNVLNNFSNSSSSLHNDDHNMAHVAGQVGRMLICATMFVVYPVDSIVLRHVCVVFFFRGRKAHEGDAESVLERWDRRVGTTVAIYVMTMVPALLTENVGNVLAISGTIGASCLAYIGPGLIYMAVYGEEFLSLVDETWGVRSSSSATAADDNKSSLESSSLLANIASPKPETICEKLFKDILWYILLMPLWCIIADRGQKRLDFFRMKESMKSPHMSRIASEQRVNTATGTSSRQQRHQADEDDEEEDGPSSSMRSSLSYNDLGVGNSSNNYGSTTAKDRAAQSTSTSTIVAKEVMVTDVEIPTWSDFIVAIFFIAFGLVALSAGMVSIFLK